MTLQRQLQLHDKNQSWEAPVGFDFDGLTAQGSYLEVSFRRRDTEGDDVILRRVFVYLNDQGREVSRVVKTERWPGALLPPPAPLPIGRWFRIKNAGFIILQGLEELFVCLSKW